MKKNALCFYGISSGINDKNEKIMHIDECFESIKKYIINNSYYDIFFHTWNNINNPNLEEYLIQLYNPKNYIIDNQIQFINKNKETKHIEHYNASKSRWYSSKKVIELKEQYEYINNFNYNITFVCRFDCFFFNHYNLHELKLNNSLYLSNWTINEPYKETMKCYMDLFMFGNYEILNKFKNLYDFIDDYLIELNSCSAHSFIYHHTIKQNINVILYKYALSDHNISRRLNFKKN